MMNIKKEKEEVKKGNMICFVCYWNGKSSKVNLAKNLVMMMLSHP